MGGGEYVISMLFEALVVLMQIKFCVAWMIYNGVHFLFRSMILGGNKKCFE